MAQMKAVLCTKYGGVEGLQVQEAARPKPSASELLVKVYASALNRADLLQRRGLYPPPQGASEILGLEVAGEVVDYGEQVSQFAKGDRVFALVPGGGYAQYCCVDATMAMPIPRRLNYVEAAAVPAAFLTAQEALFSLGNLQKNQSVLIHAGASGVGCAAIQLAHAVDATIYFTAGSDPKIDAVLPLGATEGINYRQKDFVVEVLELTEQQGVDLIIDFIGGDYLMRNQAILRKQGTIVQVGFMQNRMAQLDLSRLLFQRQQIKGLVMRLQSVAEKRKIVARFVERWLPSFESGALRPVVDRTFALHEVAQAHDYMEENQNIGKIVLTIE